MGDGDEFEIHPHDRSVCSACFGDKHISAFITETATSKACDFCRRKSRKRLIAARLDEVIDFMRVAINREYELAVDALGWDGQEGGYQGHHFDTRELLEDEIGIDLPKDDGNLLDAIADCIGDDT